MITPLNRSRLRSPATDSLGPTAFRTALVGCPRFDPAGSGTILCTLSERERQGRREG